MEPASRGAAPRSSVADYGIRRGGVRRIGAVSGNGALTAIRTSLAERLAELRGVDIGELPGPLLDVALRKLELPGGDVMLLRPADWEALRHEEGGAGRPVPFWARLWPSGEALAATLDAAPPRPGAKVLELGCGLGAPSIVAARAGANVLATDGATDAVAYVAHSMVLNGTEAEVAAADWAEQGEALVERGPYDLVMGADVLYTRGNAETALRLLPRLVAAWGTAIFADPGRANSVDFLAAIRATFALRSRRHGDISLHELTPR